MNSFLYVCGILLFLPPFIDSFHYNGRSSNVPRCIRSSLTSHSLTSALESASLDPVIWKDPADLLFDKVVENGKSRIMPLYPLSATYLPTANGVNYTLRNTEPRNIQMALDLLSTNDLEDDNDDGNDAKEPVFCVVLRAVDTGRLAMVGTVMKIVDSETQHDSNGQVARILLTCQAVECVDIISIRNPDAYNLESRLRKSKEYLFAKVAPRTDTINSSEVEAASQRETEMLVQDYMAVRKFYLAGVADKDLPVFSLSSLEMLQTALPGLTTANFTVENFWQAAHVWQTLCYTIREGCQIRMATDRNELLVAAAIRQGGVLQLPIHLGDIPSQDREQIVQLEVEAQRAWMEMRLDPCIDFQVLLSINNHYERIKLLGNMISRERQRLEHLALYTTYKDEDWMDLGPTNRRGAWFEDDL